MRHFPGIGEFALHMLETAVVVAETMHHAIEHGAEAIEKRAKEKIGEYQDQVGPFIAWPELADSTKADRVAKGFAENEPLLRTGEMRDSIEHMCEGFEAQIGSNNDKAVWQELGTSRIPPRSFLGGSAAEIAPKIAEMVGVGAVAALVGNGVHEGRLLIEGVK